jgi:TRAP-type C4-dicarboxylate transport system permease small subunit
MIATLRSALDRTMAVLAGIACLLMFGVVLASSASRYFLNMPFHWSEELAKYAMIYGTMFGVILAYHRSEHMRFTILVDLLGPHWAARLGRVTDVFVVITGGILLYSGYLFMMARGGMISVGLGVPMAYPQAAMMIGGGCLALAGVLALLGSKTHDRDVIAGAGQ